MRDPSKLLDTQTGLVGDLLAESCQLLPGLRFGCLRWALRALRGGAERLRRGRTGGVSLAVRQRPSFPSLPFHARPDNANVLHPLLRRCHVRQSGGCGSGRLEDGGHGAVHEQGGQDSAPRSGGDHRHAWRGGRARRARTRGCSTTRKARMRPTGRRWWTMAGMPTRSTETFLVGQGHLAYNACIVKKMEKFDGEPLKPNFKWDADVPPFE